MMTHRCEHCQLTNCACVPKHQIHSFYMSCNQMTVNVDVKKGRIVCAPPILRNFIGQKHEDLITWMKKIGQFKMAEL